MKRNYAKFISVTLVLVVVLTVFAFPTPVYAGDQAPVCEQTAFAVFEDNSGDVGTQIGSDSNPVTVTPGQDVFVCIQMDFSTIMKKHSMIGQWRTWGDSWTSMATSPSSTDWEYWDSNYTDHTSNEVSDHFGDTAAGNYIFESDNVGFDGNYPESQVADLHETWFVIQAPDTAARYEIRWYDTTEPYAPTPTVQVDITVADQTSWGGIFYNKPDDTTEQTEAGTYPDGLYTYLYEDSSSDPLEAGTQYTFYVNVHEWEDEAIASGGTLSITIPKEFTSVALVDKTDFSDAGVSGGGASDWTISGTNDAAISNSVDHLSFNATTPTGYGVNTNWEFDTRFTGTGGQSETVRYIVEAVVLVQAASVLPDISNSPDNYPFGVVAESSTTETGLTHFTVTNNSGYDVNITIGGTDMTGGTAWTLSDTATPGTDTYGLKAGLSGDDYNIIVKKTGPYNTLKSGLADSGTQDWGLQLLAPDTFTGGGANSGNVTLTATQA